MGHGGGRGNVSGRFRLNAGRSLGTKARLLGSGQAGAVVTHPQQQPSGGRGRLGRFGAGTHRHGGRGGAAGAAGRGGGNSASSSTLVQFAWSRSRLFDYISSFVLYEKVLEAGQATVTSVTGRPANRYRPFPMNSVDFAMMASRYLRMSSTRAAEIAEKLYQRGYISYPRTETQVRSCT